MNVFEKIVIIIICVILPKSIREAIINRVKRTKNVFLSSFELKILSKFLKIIFFPLSILIALMIALIKIFFIWILPTKKYNDYRYLINQFYTDIIHKNMNLKIAFKRVCLCYELFTKGAERKVSFGEKNPELTFYVLRPYYFLERNELVMNVSNLLFHYYRNLEHLAYGVEKGWIPVVDWENYGPFAHQENYPINGTKNCWEYYWNQPSNFTLEEVYQSKNVILSVQNTRDNAFLPSCFFKTPLQKQAEDYARRCPKYDKLITLNEMTAKYIDEKEKEIFPNDARILGVSIRGTSYGDSSSLSNVNGHPIQPDLVKLLKNVEILINEWNMDYIFITCELESVIETFKAKFGNKVLYLKRLRYKTAPQRGDVEKGLDPLYVPGQKYKTNLDYLTEMVLLSRCTSLAAAMSSGVRAAIIWNNKRYENMKIFENGLW